jgi:uncharacterized protein YkwD
MRWIPCAAAAALLASCMAVQMTPPPPPPPQSRPAAPSGAGPASGQGLVEQMVEVVNAHRRAARCPELAWLPQAARAAQAHSDDMARRGYFDHTSPDGQGLQDRLRVAGVPWRAIAENIALHPGAPREVLAGWLDSPGHRRNLDNCVYTHHGIGLRDGRWTHVFVTPPPPAPAGR